MSICVAFSAIRTQVCLGHTLLVALNKVLLDNLHLGVVGKFLRHLSIGRCTRNESIGLAR